MLRPRSRHHADDGHHLNREFQIFLRVVQEDFPDNFIRRAVRAGKHFRNAFFGGQDDGQPIRPAPFIKVALQIVLSVGLKHRLPDARPQNGSEVSAEFVFADGFGERLDHFVNHRALRCGVFPFDVTAKHRRRHADDWMRRVDHAQRNAVKAEIIAHEAGKFVRRNGRCGDSVFRLECAGASGDRHGAAGSTGNAQDRGLAVVVDFLPKVFGIVAKDVACLLPADRRDRRHVLSKPPLYLV